MKIPNPNTPCLSCRHVGREAKCAHPDLPPRFAEVVFECSEFAERPTLERARPSRWEAIGIEVGRLVAEKQAAYGDSFGKAGAVMRILYPEGVAPEKLDDALTVVRVLDKLFRIATDRDALGESPWRDVAGYALLSVARTEKAKP